eukprot:2174852-Rhodomonas_salina.1
MLQRHNNSSRFNASRGASAPRTQLESASPLPTKFDGRADEEQEVDEMYRSKLTAESSAEAKKSWILKMGGHMLFSGNISLPALKWGGESASDEESEVCRLNPTPP